MSNKDIVIFGAGGLGREVAFQISESNKKDCRFNILGYVDDSPENEGKQIGGYPVLGNTEWLLNYDKELNVAICLGSSALRKKIFETLSVNENLHFPSIIADDLICSESVKMGKGCIICFSCVITVDIEIGDFVLISNACTVGHDARIEDFVTLFPAVNISGNVRLGQGCEMGVGSQIIQGLCVGENSVVGAGAVVVRDLPENVTAVGVPARAIKSNQLR